MGMKRNDKISNINLDRKRVDTPYAIEVEDLVIRYETSDEVVEAVNSINIKLEKKHTLGLVGETGAGKTTAMLSLLKMVPNPPGVIKQGKILVDGLDIMKLNPAELQAVRGKTISMIFQDPMTSLNPVISVGDQIAESILLHQNISKQEAMVQAKNMLETVGIDPNRSSDYPFQFSGGMRQRVDIAIALACNPDILIADEPTSALDVTIQAQILRMMRKLKAEFDMSMILITHDLGVVAELCDEVAVMYAGQIVEYGTLKEVFEDTRHAYTQGLFDSLPNIHKRTKRLVPIPGLMPDPSKLPPGCAFADRCPYASQKCREARPGIHPITDTHYVACTAYDDPNFSLNRRN